MTTYENVRNIGEFFAARSWVLSKNKIINNFLYRCTLASLAFFTVRITTYRCQTVEMSF